MLSIRIYSLCPVHLPAWWFVHGSQLKPPHPAPQPPTTPKGGAREVNKPRGSDYTLLWPDDRPDFVRLAGKTGAIIVPFAAVGADDAYDVMMDVDQVLEVRGRGGPGGWGWGVSG